MKKPNHNLIYEYRLPYGPLCSPTGRFAVYGVKQAEKETNRYSFRIHLMNLETGRDQVLNEDWNCPYYFWNGSDELLLAKKEGDGTVFMKWAPDLKEVIPAFRISKNCISAKYSGLPDSKILLLLVREKIDSEEAEETASAQAYTVIDELPYWANGAGYVNGVRNRLYLYNESDGALLQISSDTGDVTLYEKDHSSSDPEDPCVLYAECRFDGCCDDRPGIYRYHIRSQITEMLLEPGNYYVRLLCSTENSILFSGSRGETYGKYQYDGFYRFSDSENAEDPFQNSASHWELFARHEANAGLCSIISDTLTGIGQKMKVSGNRLYFLSTVNDRCSIFCLSTETGIISEIPAKCTAVESFDLLPNQNETEDCKEQFLFCGTGGGLPSELYYLADGGSVTSAVFPAATAPAASGASQLIGFKSCKTPFFRAESQPENQVKKIRLTSYQSGLQKNYQLSVREELSFINSDGVTIRGWVMRPPASVKTGGLPAIICIHGGPRSVYGDVYCHEMQLMAAAGYFVCFYNGRGSDSRGNEFGDINGRYGREDMTDLLEFTDRVLLRYPEIDPGRLGLSGGSYGGYLVNWVLGHSSRFAAAVSQRSISNWITQEALSDIGYYYVPDQAKASLLSGEAGKLWENSPLKYADRIETPLLLLHSDEDRRCGLQEAQQLFYVLKRRKIPCRMIVFHGENHELNKNGKPENRIARIRLILEWMGKYL